MGYSDEGDSFGFNAFKLEIYNTANIEFGSRLGELETAAFSDAQISAQGTRIRPIWEITSKLHNVPLMGHYVTSDLPLLQISSINGHATFSTVLTTNVFENLVLTEELTSKISKNKENIIKVLVAKKFNHDFGRIILSTQKVGFERTSDA